LRGVVVVERGGFLGDFVGDFVGDFGGYFVGVGGCLLGVFDERGGLGVW